MYYIQNQLNSEEIQNITLYDFNAKNELVSCIYEQTCKAYLMKVKAKDRTPLFIAVEFVTQREFPSE